MSLDVVRARVVFRHRSLADVLDLALRFLVVHGRSYAKVALATTAPLFLAAMAVASLAGWGWGWTLAALLALAAQVPFTLLASRLVFQDHVSVREVVRDSLGQIPRVLFARVLALGLAAMGALVMLIPGVWIAMIVFFTSEVMLLERATVAQSFGRAQRLAGSSSGDTLLAMSVAGLLVAAAVALADVAGRALIGELLQFTPPASLWSEGGSALALLGLFAFMPYLATARFFVYLNVRTRAEGWDIQTRFAALAARAAQERAPEEEAA